MYCILATVQQQYMCIPQYVCKAKSVEKVMEDMWEVSEVD